MSDQGQGRKRSSVQPHISTPKLPLLPVWEKGAGGMRGKGARECRTSLISPKNSTLERKGVGGMRGKTGAHAGHPRSRRKPQVRAPFQG
jgi:hypothetical protein